MYRKTFYLKQHTPLIHFQHEQEGATLRATEVKPRLDDYLIKNGFRSERNDYDHLLIGGSRATTTALDYKMSITVASKRTKDVNQAKGYFGNIGGETGDKQLVYNEGICITCTSVHKELIIKLGIHFGEFLRCTNFGTRKSRGFGSFTLDKDRLKPAISRYHFTVGGNDWSTHRNIPLDLKCADHIDWFYRSLRQGINHGRFDHNRGFIPYLYMKPMIFQYAMNENIQWEKKTIKERFFDRKLQDQTAEYPALDGPVRYAGRNMRIVRDLLGLSSEQTWMNYGNPTPRVTKEYEYSGDGPISIERFPSPIVFKPIQHDGDDFFTVYFWWETADLDIFKTSSFKIKVNGRDGGHQAMEVWKEFDMDAFMNFALDYDRAERSLQLHDQKGIEPMNLILNIYHEITGRIV